MQKRLFDIVWSSDNKSQRKHLPLPMLERSQTSDPRGIMEVGANIEDIKEGMEGAERHRDALFF